MSHLSFNSLHCAFISSIESFNNFNLAGYFLNKVVPIRLFGYSLSDAMGFVPAMR